MKIKNKLEINILVGFTITQFQVVHHLALFYFLKFFSQFVFALFIKLVKCQLEMSLAFFQVPSNLANYQRPFLFSFCFYFLLQLS